MSSPAEIFSFNNSNSLNEDLLYADTSFVWELYGSQNGSRQADCHNFSTKAVKEGSVFVISPMVVHELKNVTLRELLKKEASKLGVKPHHRKHILSNTPGIMSKVQTHVDNIMGIINQDPNFVVLDSDASHKLSGDLSSKYNLDINDSVILATMIENEIYALVTLDGDYISVNDQGLKIYTNHTNYLKLTQQQTQNLPNNSSGSAS